MNEFYEIVDELVPPSMRKQFISWAFGPDILEKARDPRLANQAIDILDRWNRLHGQIYRVDGPQFTNWDLEEIINLFFDISERKLNNHIQGIKLDVEE